LICFVSLVLLHKLFSIYYKTVKCTTINAIMQANCVSRHQQSSRGLSRSKVLLPVLTATSTYVLHRNATPCATWHKNIHE